jgi:hypothetical protein
MNNYITTKFLEKESKQYFGKEYNLIFPIGSNDDKLDKYLEKSKTKNYEAFIKDNANLGRWLEKIKWLKKTKTLISIEEFEKEIK